MATMPSSPLSPTYTEFSTDSEFPDLRSPLDDAFDAATHQQQHLFSNHWSGKPATFSSQHYYDAGAYQPDDAWQRKEYAHHSGRAYSYAYQPAYDAPPESPASPISPWSSSYPHMQSQHQHQHQQPLSPVQQRSVPGIAYSASLPYASSSSSTYHPHAHTLHHSVSMQHLSGANANAGLQVPTGVGRAHSQSVSYYPTGAPPPQQQQHHHGVDPRMHSPYALSIERRGSASTGTAPTSAGSGSGSVGEAEFDADLEDGDGDEDGDDADGDSDEYVDNGSDSDGDFVPAGHGAVRRSRASGGARYAPYGYAADLGSYPYSSSNADSSFPFPSNTNTAAADLGLGLGLLPGQRRPRARSAALPAPIPVPNLTKKSRGRRVPTVESLYAQEGRKSSKGASGARMYACAVAGCGKCFARGEHLKRHVRSIHTYEKRAFFPSSLPTILLSFISHWTLGLMRVPSLFAAHKCPYPGCGKDFSRHDNLGQHMRVHKDFVGRV
ncbi:Transcriptional regulator MNL1 [Mycena kentingensis (nom. inval.)]|nr:Transcriptional regulator MNL1 [Mycena kentingensis (nom. inval.)]